MREITTTCYVCGKKFRMKGTWFDFCSIDIINKLRFYFHTIVKHRDNVTDWKKFSWAIIKNIGFAIIAIILDIIHSILKLILFPFGWVYNQL